MIETNSAQARIDAQNKKMRGQIVGCEKCGSTYFYSVLAIQISKGYGSVEVTSAPSTQEFQTWKCAGCNFPVAPQVPAGRRASGVFETAHAEYRAAITAGQEYLNSIDTKKAVKTVLEAAAGKQTEDDVIEINQNLSRIDNILEDIRDRVTNVEEKVLAPAHTEELMNEQAETANTSSATSDSSFVPEPPPSSTVVATVKKGGRPRKQEPNAESK